MRVEQLATETVSAPGQVTWRATAPDVIAPTTFPGPALPGCPHRHPGSTEGPLLCLADGISVVPDKVFRTGSCTPQNWPDWVPRITRDGPTAMIHGVEQLSGPT
ncbi:MAG: hypothetical protein Ct9H300mP1_38730 [Planctomycetaceae bacterium]|nr:MAG: hypothetical protein Ct9H300mP1_38730 [Planctomycetaceae bacterium]